MEAIRKRHPLMQAMAVMTITATALYMKYSTMHKEDDKVTDKNRFKSYMMKRDEEGHIYCPQGHAFTLDRSKESTKGRYPRTIKFYRNEHCERCPLRSQCTRSKKGRTLQITDKLNELQSEAKENLSTEIGKELMKQRSIQAEGIFGIIASILILILLFVKWRNDHEGYEV